MGGRERSYQGQEVSLDRQALLGVVHHVHELTDHRQVKDDVDPRYLAVLVLMIRLKAAHFERYQQFFQN